MSKLTADAIEDLLSELQPTIADEYRCSDDPEDTEPGMCITVATTNGVDWGWQSGDNSYSGGAYSYAHWSVILLMRSEEDLTMLASAAYDELMDAVCVAHENSENPTKLKYHELKEDQDVTWTDPDGIDSGIYKITDIGEYIGPQTSITIENETDSFEVYLEELS
jgi:hypothetical protein